jgi:phosphatidylserine/phosphatidylglycerophosphate/cardiolipin synthase-like enzyme
VIDVRTLTDGGQTPESVADQLIAFFDGATSSLHAAVYDVRVEGVTEARGQAALRAAHERGVDIRLVYELEEEAEEDGRDPLPAPPGTDPETLRAERYPSHGISTREGLMHHKYVIRDGRTVWTGSMNWTEDSWTRQENVIVVIDSKELAYAYGLNYEELWRAETVESTGNVDGARVRAWFCPEYGKQLAHRVAKHVGKARERIRIASPVLSSSPILAALVEVVNERRCDLAGVVDDTQVDEVFWQWKGNGVSEWKIPLLRRVLEGAPFSGKISTRWSPGSVHDYMHAKVVVTDDTSFVGSFNFSRAGERNAENVVEIRDRSVADRLAAYVDEVRERYPPATPPGELAPPATSP